MKLVSEVDVERLIKRLHDYRPIFKRLREKNTLYLYLINLIDFFLAQAFKLSGV